MYVRWMLLLRHPKRYKNENVNIVSRETDKLKQIEYLRYKTFVYS